MLSTWFPEGVPGYDTAPGVTIGSRLHPEQMPLGLRAGAFQVWPRLDESVGYTSNVLSGTRRQGSWQIVTEPTLAINSDWSRNAFGAVLSAQNMRYLSVPSQDWTNATLSAGGRIDLGGGQFTLAASHLALHEVRSRIDAVASDRPIAFQIDDARASYTWTLGRWSVVPSLQASHWTYGNAIIQGIPSDQSYRDRLVGQGAVTLRYEWAPLRNLLFVVRALGQDYLQVPPGQPTANSASYQVLGGLDTDSAVWRWRVLIGGEVRQFTSPVYPQQNTLIAEAGVTWSPTGMTSLGFTLDRETADAAQEGISGLTYTAARLSIDHEILRNLVFKASVALQQADFFQGGYQRGSTAGAGLTWVLNRSLRLSFTYDQTDLLPAHGNSAPGYSGGLGLVTVRLGL
ncbi:MAG: outer membrane beta-barrel protein [Rhodopila sp.]